MSAYAPRWAEVHTLCRGAGAREVHSVKMSISDRARDECVETARRRGLTTKAPSCLDASLNDVLGP